MELFKECMELMPLLRRSGIAVEKELARIQEQAPKFSRVHEELAAIRYYLHVALMQCQQRWRTHVRALMAASMRSRSCWSSLIIASKFAIAGL
jgi:hypothetical protein